MSKLEELIARLCPDGVEYKELGEVLKIKNGKDYKGFDFGNIPVYGSGGIMTYIDQYVYDKPSVLIPRKGSIDKLYYVDTPFWNVDTIFYTEINNKIVLPRYVYHCLLKEHLEQYNTAGGVPSLTQKVLNKVKVPVPPLEVQREIVRVLDSYTVFNNELKEQLEKELAARQKQYEFYRDMLLTFDNVRSVGTSVEWHAIGDICLVFTGGDPPSDCIKGNCPDSKHPYPVWGNGREVYGYSGSYRIDKDAVVISSIGANTGAVYFREAFFTPIIRLKVVLPKDNKLDSRYLYHFLSSMKIESKSSSVPNMNASEIKKIRIPVPDLDIQTRMVHVLDTFYRITTDLVSGLPAEIEARKKQYEYYRDKLLTFKELKKEA